MRSNGLLHPAAISDLPVLSRWLGNGFWAVADTGLFSMSNFVLAVLLARWLSPTDYGAFTVGFAIFLFFGTVHIGLLLEPMLVLGADRYRHRLQDYLDAVLWGHTRFAALAAVLCVLVGMGLWLSGSTLLSPALFSLGFAAPFILLLWFMRTVCYVRLTTRSAAAGGLLYLVLMVAGAYALHLRNWLSPASAFGVMCISSLVAALWLAARLKQGLPRLHDGKMLNDVIRSHWRLGCWMTGNNFLYWFLTHVWYVVLPVWGGLAASGSFRALVIFIFPFAFAIYAVSRVLVGGLVRIRGDHRFERSLRVALLLTLSASIVYWVLLGVFGRFAVIWLYGGQYGDHHLLWLLGGALPLEGASAVARAALQAVERPDLAFRARVVSSLAVCLVGVPLALTFGVSGAVAGFVLAHLVCAGLMWTLVGRMGAGSELPTVAVGEPA